ncbi:MAG TPA: Flp family type IVb pilin [Candidatus Limnocylindria bacterium]|nr:Flp family type IVb pilin [Candidatus Limnocylindria bacterium]
MRERDETGASAVEYGLLAVAVAALITVIVFAFGGLVHDLFAGSCSEVNNANTAHGGTPASC